MKKNLLIALLAITTTFCGAFGFTACGEKEFEKVSGSEGLEYTLSDDGTYYYLSGLGTCTDTEITIANYYNDLPVKQIGKYNLVTEESAGSDFIITEEESKRLHFFANSNVTSVIIPEGITTIGYGAFVQSGLEHIAISDSVTVIGSFAFGYCSCLTNLTLPDSVDSIGVDAFLGCENLTSIELSKNLVFIGNDAFGCCYSLKSITIPASVKTIDDEVFMGCSKLESITIGNGVTSIGSGIFRYCYELTDINYNGTKEQWNAIDKKSYWDGIYEYTIHCTDGDIVVENRE